MSRRKNKFRTNFHVTRLFPNLLTLLGLCAGLSAIRYGLYGKWETAVIFIIIAALIDGVDGRLARMLNSVSSFGAHLDSLCDLVNFGVAPALTLYLWKTSAVRGFGWAFVLLFAICAALRLARFNTQIEDSEPYRKWADRFFVGIPAPAGAGLCLLPLMVSFWAEENSLHGLQNFFLFQPVYLSLYMGFIGVMMASRIPTFSIKKITVKPEYISLTLIFLGIFIIALIIEPWLTFPVLGIIYFLSIPISVFGYWRLKKRHNQMATTAS